MFSNPFTDPKWAERTTNFIDKWVGFVRNKTTQPLIKVARGLVFGLIAAFGIVVAVALFLIGVVRALQILLDLAFSRDVAVWSSYLILGGLCMLGGFVLMRKRFGESEK